MGRSPEAARRRVSGRGEGGYYAYTDSRAPPGCRATSLPKSFQNMCPTRDASIASRGAACRQVPPRVALHSQRFRSGTRTSAASANSAGNTSITADGDTARHGLVAASHATKVTTVKAVAAAAHCRRCHRHGHALRQTPDGTRARQQKGLLRPRHPGRWKWMGERLRHPDTTGKPTQAAHSGR